MKILNLYAGIGGNRKLWGNEHEITAIELDPQIVEIYKNLFPNDKVIVTDAHQFLLEHYKEYEFIWTSPPCPTHSKMAMCWKNRLKAKYPDMRLYQEILLLKYYFKGFWVVENVQGYYKPLIEPQKSGRHYFWSNIKIPEISDYNFDIKESKIKKLSEMHGFDLTKINIPNKKTILRNCVNSELGRMILNATN